MKIRLMGTPKRVEAFASVLRGVFTVVEESPDRANRPPSAQVRRYLDIELRAEPEPAPSPLSLATDAKRRRDLLGEIGILQTADADLKAQPWLPLQRGDIVLVDYRSPELGSTYLADGDDTREGPELHLISARHQIGEQDWPVSLYELWFEAGPAALTIIRGGQIIHGRPATAKAAD